MHQDEASALAQLKTEYAGLFSKPTRYAVLDRNGARRPSLKRAKTRLKLAREALANSPDDARLERECAYWSRLIEIYEHFDKQRSSDASATVIELKPPTANAELARALNELINSEKYRPLRDRKGVRTARVAVNGVRTPMLSYVNRILKSADARIAAAITDEEKAFERLRKKYWRKVRRLYNKYPIQKPSSKSA